MMNTKGQGLSMNVIIIAAIALLVLVIISVLVLRAGGNVADGTGCDGIGGKCSADCSILGDNYISTAKAGCDTEGDSCCIRLGTSSNS